MAFIVGEKPSGQPIYETPEERRERYAAQEEMQVVAQEDAFQRDFLRMLGYSDEEIDNLLGGKMPDGADSGEVGAGGSGRRALTIQLTSPEDIKAVARETARKLIGRDPDEAVLNEVVAARQAQERQVQEQAYAGGGTVTEPTAVDVTTEQSLKQAVPHEVNAQKYSDLFQVFLRLVGGSTGVSSG